MIINGPSPHVSKDGPVLIIGSTGFIGRFVTESCLDSGRPTYLLVRPGVTSCHFKSAVIKSFEEKGAITVHGSMDDGDLMEKVFRELKIEIVISAVGGKNILDQLKLVETIKVTGTVKRFLPSEFGHDIDRADPVEPGLTMYAEKRKVRRAIEKAGIPYTYICCNSIAAWPYHDNTHPADVLPPLDCFHIYGDGSVKAYFVAGTDIGKFTMKSMDDIRTVNKSVHFRPPSNLLNINELATLWEQKIGRTLPRVTITENDLLDAAREMRIPESIVASFTHDIFINGCQINFSIEEPEDLDVSSLYPDARFRTIDECFNDFLLKLVENPKVLKQASGNNNNNGIIMPAPKQEAMAIATCT
uniref:LAR n=1 Tax=Litchi chinensis TaxID=151069 RepID=A0A894JKS3_LITCN|nr:LAR [Litchi chinensis]